MIKSSLLFCILSLILCSCTGGEIRSVTESIPVVFDTLVPAGMRVYDRKIYRKKDGSVEVIIRAYCENPPHWKGAGFQDTIVEIHCIDFKSVHGDIAAHEIAEDTIGKWRDQHTVSADGDRWARKAYPHEIPSVKYGNLVLQLYSFPMPPETSSPFLELYTGIGAYACEQRLLVVEFSNAMQQDSTLSVWFDEIAGAFAGIKQGDNN